MSNSISISETFARITDGYMTKAAYDDKFWIFTYNDRADWLYYIAHLNNMESIFENGIMSLNEIKESGIDYTTIANQSVQEKREAKGIHDYANLYFNPRNAMMYARRNEPDVCVLIVSCSVLDIRNVIITDGNATNYATTKYNAKDVGKLDFDMIYRRSWNGYDDLKRTMMAEVHVKKVIPQEYIKGIVARDDRNINILKNRYGHERQIITNGDMFFR